MLGWRRFNIESKSNHQEKSQKKKQYTVAVEGNIGSGKSTFIEHFRQTKSVEVIPEPVDLWKDVQGYNTLDMMYKDATRWSLAFQSYVQLTMADVHRKETDCRVKMIERSVHSTRTCFVENLHQSKVMPEVDYAILSEWYDWITENEDMHVDLIVYLQASPPTCHSRVKCRNRKEEQSVPLEYLEALHKLHEDWLVRKTTSFKTPAPVLIINTDCTREEMYRKFDLYRDEILLNDKEN